MGNLNMLREGNGQACLTKGSSAGCHTRWRGLESHQSLAYYLPLEIARGTIFYGRDDCFCNELFFIFFHTWPWRCTIGCSLIV